jgi:hypothetical protein
MHMLKCRTLFVLACSLLPRVILAQSVDTVHWPIALPITISWSVTGRVEHQHIRVGNQQLNTFWIENTADGSVSTEGGMSPFVFDQSGNFYSATSIFGDHISLIYSTVVTLTLDTVNHKVLDVYCYHEDTRRQSNTTSSIKELHLKDLEYSKDQIFVSDSNLSNHLISIRDETQDLMNGPGYQDISSSTLTQVTKISFQGDISGALLNVRQPHRPSTSLLYEFGSTPTLRFPTSAHARTITFYSELGSFLYRTEIRPDQDHLAIHDLRPGVYLAVLGAESVRVLIP